MAEDEEIPVIVHVSEPKGPANSLNAGTADRQLVSMAMSFGRQESFESVWKKIAARFESSYNEKKRVGITYEKLQLCMNADLAAKTDIFGKYFNKNMPKEDRVLYMRTITVDRDCSIPVGSLLWPAGYTSKRLEDLAPGERAAFLRQQAQAGRYGASLDELDADTPVVSRETAQEQPDGHGTSSREHRVDKDGFKIPQIIKTASRKRKTSQTHDSQATVLVEDSQTQPSTKRVRTAAAVLREGLAAELSSPTESAAARASAPQQPGPVRFPSREDNGNTAERAATTPGRVHKSLPTPESRERLLSNNEAPTSAQRPRSSQAPMSARSARFIAPSRAAAPEPEDNMAVDDPIEDDDEGLPTRAKGHISAAENFLGADDEHDNEGEGGGDVSDHEGEPPVRTRSSSADRRPRHKSTSRVQRQSSPPSSSPTIQRRDGNDDSSRPRSTTAFDNMASSQAGRARSARPLRTDRWTKSEDKLLLRGIRNGFQPFQILQQYDLHRSDSGLRNRRAFLIKTFPNGNVPENSDWYEPPEDNAASAGESVTPAPPATQRRAWLPQDVAVLRKAMIGGYDKVEIRDKHFPKRSTESVSKKMAELEEGVLKTAMKTEDFPHDDGKVHGWTGKHALKLRRARNERVPEHEAWKRWFSNFSRMEIQQKLKAYDAQLRDMEHAPANNTSKSEQPSEQAAARASRTPTDEDPASPIDQIYSQPSTQGQTQSSPLRSKSGHAAPKATTTISHISQAPQQNARNTQAKKSNGNERQATLPFAPDKRKKRAGLPRPSIAEVDQQYRRMPSHSTTRPAAPSPQAQQTDSQEAIEISSDDSSDDEESEVEEVADVQRQIDSQLVGSQEWVREASSKPDPVHQDTTDQPIAYPKQDDHEKSQQPVEPSEVLGSANQQESQAFQTQDTGTSLSQRKQQHALPAETAQLPTINGTSGGTVSSLISPTPNSQSDTAAKHPPPDDVATPFTVQGADNSLPRPPSSQHSTQSLNHPANVAPAQPGKLPQRNGKASRFQEMMNQARTQTRSDSSTQCLSQPRSAPSPHSQKQSAPPPQSPQQRSAPSPQSQQQSAPQVRSDSPPLEFGPPDKNNQVSVGLWPFTTKMHYKNAERLTEKYLWAEAQREAANPDDVQDLFEQRKLNAQQHIGISTSNRALLLRLKEKERRMRREHREKRGLPRPTLRKKKQVTTEVENENGEIDIQVDEVSVTDSEAYDWMDGEEEEVEEDSDEEIDNDSDEEMAENADAEIEEHSDEEMEDVHGHRTKPAGTQSNLRSKVQRKNRSVMVEDQVPVEHEDDDDFGLPTGPPPDDVEGMEDAAAPSNAELQALVQSENIDVYDDQGRFIRTRQDSAEVNSPVVPLSPVLGAKGQDVDDDVSMASSLVDTRKHAPRVNGVPHVQRSNGPIDPKKDKKVEEKNETNGEKKEKKSKKKRRIEEDGDGQDAVEHSTNTSGGPKAGKKRKTDNEQNLATEQKQQKQPSPRVEVMMPPPPPPARKKHKSERKGKQRTKRSDGHSSLGSASERSTSVTRSVESNIVGIPTRSKATTAPTPDQVIRSIEPQGVAAVNGAQQATPKKRGRGRKVTPIGETQNTDDGPASMPQRGGVLNGLRSRFLSTIQPHYPPAPAPRQEQQPATVKLPFATDDEEDSNSGSD
ncbi:hypothetical protein LTR37_017608 [Vermiconidia calcicola]|uniref:Uncharacterized protein n=1 Tax=Vermiconidia calcicola TaxID=1690605 RepID=A0ACC3MJG4_9PEZI|nr:hypothetical protein LTR37_017608 [Vermiconidia calcicola]